MPFQLKCESFPRNYVFGRILTSDIKLPGYHETFRNDRNCFGGGVLAYKAEYWHVIRRNDLEFNGRYCSEIK
jgi:alpha-acetolactate decarboxylase